MFDKLARFNPLKSLSAVQIRSAVLKTILGTALLLMFSTLLLLLASFMWQKETAFLSIDRVVVFTFSQPGVVRAILASIGFCVPVMFVLAVLDELLYENRIKRLFWVLRDLADGARSKMPSHMLGGYEEEIGDLVRRCAVIARESGASLSSRFLSDAGHEIRTPLSIIKGRIELALMKDRNASYYKEKLEDVLRQVGFLETLVKGLMELSRLEGTDVIDLRPTDLSMVAEEAIDSLSSLISSKSMRIRRSMEGAPVMGDADLLVSMCRQMIENACRYSPPGSFVDVSVRMDRRGGRAIVSVKDYGIGMDEETSINCFQPFWRADESRSTGGHGLGLTIAKRIASLHSGYISVKSVPGKGSTFTFSMPLDDTLI
ncbi:signal transduction histidine kinase [Thermanaerovibrio velox DSM 12556]|uniref:histidine kinase n=1 Tax=Thermanaerovibrio velox DSM 12556 TaxID=926567 RepID=H0USB6_9BACT|nr:HAMP domain-containing sensor histidine kinase [Thermanaerovibrio velox]EHM10205.1 signal transduction histidine kinase [Thermanaerovibrio velox DSM 12556]